LAFMNVPPGNLSTYTEGATIDVEALTRELERTKKRGYAVSQSELIQGAVAAAAPFFDRSGQVAGSFGIFGPEVRLGKTALNALVPRVVQYAGEISAALGYSGNSRDGSD